MLVLLLANPCARAQASVQAADAIPLHTEDALHAMVQAAAVIFAGEVIAVRRYDGINGATGVVEIDFAVDDAILGVGGSTYTLREWAGLWPAGFEPFRVGERYLMLLHAPGPAGLSSPVGGNDGAIPIRGSGAQTAGTVKASLAGNGSAPDGRVVDLRWVATRVARAVTYRSEPAYPTAAQVAVAEATRALQVDLAEPSSSGTPAAQGATYTAVLGVLRRWEKVDNAAR
jgi:hypothetical protein